MTSAAAYFFASFVATACACVAVAGLAACCAGVCWLRRRRRVGDDVDDAELLAARVLAPDPPGHRLVLHPDASLAMAEREKM